MKYIYTPITLTNSQPQASPSNFQQLIQVPTPQYLNGVRFWSPTDGYLLAWLESIQSNSANIWMKIPSSIPANGTYQLYMIQDSTLSMDRVYWGEAPQLSSTYGQYDNGENVFNFYDNFAGTILSSKWTGGASGGSYTVNNGLTITVPYNAAGGNYSFISTSSYTITSAQIVESYANLNGFYTTNFRITPVALTQYNNAAFLKPNDNGVGWAGNVEGLNTVSADAVISGGNNFFETSQIISTSTYQLWGITYPDNGNVSVQYNYNNWGSTTTNVPATPLYLTISNFIGASQTSFSTTYPINVYYIRARAYPPNGVMPTASFGTSQYSGELITVTVP